MVGLIGVAINTSFRNAGPPFDNRYGETEYRRNLKGEHNAMSQVDLVFSNVVSTGNAQLDYTYTEDEIGPFRILDGVLFQGAPVELVGLERKSRYRSLLEFDAIATVRVELSDGLPDVGYALEKSTDLATALDDTVWKFTKDCSFRNNWGVIAIKEIAPETAPTADAPALR